MKVLWSSKIKGLAVIECERHSDPRGIYQLVFDTQLWSRSALDIDAYSSFKPYQTSYSKSSFGVLRGLHGDFKTSKLISCPLGSFQLIVVDVHSKSPTYGCVEVFKLHEDSTSSILIPPTCANGHLVTSQTSIFHYLQDTSYGFHDQFTLTYTDSLIAHLWEFQPLKVSERDQHEALTFAELVDSFI